MTTRLIEECFIVEQIENYFPLIVDPSMINLEDLKNLGPGKIIRLKKPNIAPFGWIMEVIN